MDMNLCISISIWACNTSSQYILNHFYMCVCMLRCEWGLSFFLNLKSKASAREHSCKCVHTVAFVRVGCRLELFFCDALLTIRLFRFIVSSIYWHNKFWWLKHSIFIIDIVLWLWKGFIKLFIYLIHLFHLLTIVNSVI